MRVQMIQCIESIIDRVVKLFTHLRSLRDRFLGGPILGLFLSPFLRVQKWGKIGVGASFSAIEKLSMLLYDILTTTRVDDVVITTHTQRRKTRKMGSGVEKKSAGKVPSIRRFRGVP